MKAMTKRLFVMMMAVMMVVAMTACGGKKDDDKTTGSGNTTQAPAGDSAGDTAGDNAGDTENDNTESGSGNGSDDATGSGDGSGDVTGSEDGSDEAVGGEDEFPAADAELSAILAQMYEKVPTVQEIALGEPMPIDLTGEDFSYWLGVEDAAGIKSAIFSEPMMSSVAYSVCLIQAEEGADIEQLKENIFNKVNPVKWLCVTAEKVLVTNSGNTILLVMTNAEVTGELYNAFVSVMGDNVGEKLERNGE